MKLKKGEKVLWQGRSRLKRADVVLLAAGFILLAAAAFMAAVLVDRAARNGFSGGFSEIFVYFLAVFALTLSACLCFWLKGTINILFLDFNAKYTVTNRHVYVVNHFLCMEIVRFREIRHLRVIGMEYNDRQKKNGNIYFEGEEWIDAGPITFLHRLMKGRKSMAFYGVDNPDKLHKMLEKL